MRPCLYCSDPAKPKTAEHVLQGAFGTDLVLEHDVCGDCNTLVFSPLDTELVRFVRLYAYWDHPDVRTNRTILQDGHALYLDPDLAVWVSVRIDKNGRPVTFPQLIFTSDRTFLATMDAHVDADWEGRLTQIKSELACPEDIDFKVWITPRQKSAEVEEVQPALLRSAANKYLVRAPSEEVAQQILGTVKSGSLLQQWTTEEAGEAVSRANPRVNVRLQFKLDLVERALAKSALNFVYAAAGPQLARAAAFDEAREFVRAGVRGGGGGFVAWLFGPNAHAGATRQAQMIAKPGCHSLLLAETSGIVVVFALYERPFAVVQLTRPAATKVLPPDTIVAGLFDYRAGSSRIVRMADDPLAFGRLFGFL